LLWEGNQQRNNIQTQKEILGGMVRGGGFVLGGVPSLALIGPVFRVKNGIDHRIGIFNRTFVRRFSKSTFKPSS